MACGKKEGRFSSICSDEMTCIISGCPTFETRKLGYFFERTGVLRDSRRAKNATLLAICSLKYRAPNAPTDGPNPTVRPWFLLAQSKKSTRWPDFLPARTTLSLSSHVILTKQLSFMSIQKHLRPLFTAALLLSFQFLFSQATITTRVLSGRVTDESNGEPIPYATVGSTLLNIGTSTDENGFYELKIKKKVSELRFASIGYDTQTIQIPRDSEKMTIDVSLKPLTGQIKEVVVRSGKYRNKNNPAVELIRHVVENRDKNRVEKFGTFKEEQYEKTLMGLSNLSEKYRDKRVMKSWKFALDNIDTTLMSGVGVTPVYIQENLMDFYSRRDPKAKKIRIKASKTVKFPMMDDGGIDLYLRQLYQEVDLYDNSVVVLTNDFVSPISNNAPLLYRYYPADTTIVDGVKIVRLEFFPRQKMDMLLQGDLYIALDSTYPVTRAVFTVNPKISLNWVKTLEMEQKFAKNAQGKWVLAEEEYRMDFGLSKKGMGLFGERIVSHRNSTIDGAVPDSIFNDQFELRKMLPGAEGKADTFWNNNRHVELTQVEAATYKNIDSIQGTPLFKKIQNVLFIAVVGHYRPTPGIEIGRINTFYAWNPVEGNRFKFGGRTRPELSKRMNFEGYVAYGTEDKTFKYGGGINFSTNKNRPYNAFPISTIRVNYQEDLRTPGQDATVFVQQGISSSFTRGTNDKFFFLKRLAIQWDKEFRNKFSFNVGYDRRDYTALGSLKFIPTDEVLMEGAPVISSKPFIQIRFAPGEEYYTTKNGWRQRIKFKSIWTARYGRGVKDFLGGQYDYDELMVNLFKFTRTPPFGYNYLYVEAGGVFGKVPYPLLTIHKANQSFGYKFQAYSMMNFMEFASDRYVAVNMEQAFYGFFLNKIPLIKRLKWRELATVKVLYGQLTERNTPKNGSGLLELPSRTDKNGVEVPLTYTFDQKKKPYVEASIGIGNIFHIVRVDFIRRFTYLNLPETSKYGVRFSAKLEF